MNGLVCPLVSHLEPRSGGGAQGAQPNLGVLSKQTSYSYRISLRLLAFGPPVQGSCRLG